MKSLTRNKQMLVPIGFVLGGLLFVLIAVLMLLPDNDAVASDTPVMKTTIPMLDGSTVSLADYKGQTIMLNFWATWCPPCRAEMPELDAYYQEYADEGLIFIAVNSGEPADLAQSFITQMGYSFPVGLDEFGTLSNDLGVVALPMTFIINPEGEVHYKHNGMISREILEHQVTSLLLQN